MALQTAGMITPIPAPMSGPTPGITLDAAGEQMGFVFQAPKTGNIESCVFMLGTVTTGETLKASLQDINLATGYPDEGVDQSGTVAVADVDDDTYKTVTFGASRAVTRGDYVGLVIEFDAAVGDLEISVNPGASVNHIAYVVSKLGAWAKETKVPLFVLGYDDGSYPYVHGATPGLVDNETFSSASDPDERGNIFQVPFPCKVSGANLYADMDADTDIVLYDSDGTSVLASASIDSNVRRTIFLSTFFTWFASDVTLAIGTNYRLVFKPTSGGDIIYSMTASSAAHLEATQMGTAFRKTSRVDAGGWTEDTTVQYNIFPVFSELDDGIGGGASVLVDGGLAR